MLWRHIFSEIYREIYVFKLLKFKNSYIFYSFEKMTTFSVDNVLVLKSRRMIKSDYKTDKQLNSRKLIS